MHSFRVIRKVFLTKQTSTIETSTNAFKVLNVHQLNNIPVVWYETVEHIIIPSTIEFKLVNDESKTPDDGMYIGSAFLNNKVVHVYQS